MCKRCDSDSGECNIFFEPLTNEWYLDIETSEWDNYDDGFVHQREYIKFCPYCGKELSNEIKQMNRGGNMKTECKKGEYKYYACYKNSKNNGMYLDARDTCVEAYRDLKRLETYITNDLVFIGVIKTKGNNPLAHVCHLK